VPTLVVDAQVVGLPAGTSVKGVQQRTSSQTALKVAAPTARAVPGTRRVENVPALHGGMLLIQTSSGSFEIEQKPVGLLARIIEAPEGAPAPDPGGWDAIRTRLDTGLPQELPGGLSAVRVPEWRLRLAGAYGPIDDGKVAIEEASPVSAALNEGLTGATAARSRLFGSNPPLRAEWSVDGSGAQSASRTVAMTAGPATSQFVVKFPELKGGVVEITVRAQISDPFTNQTSATRTVASHALIANNASTLTAGIVRLLQGMNPRVAAPAGGQESRTDYLRRGAAESLAAALAEDGVITLEELRQLAKVAGYRSR
jgi:hypothetical protein